VWGIKGGRLKKVEDMLKKFLWRIIKIDEENGGSA